MDFDTYQVLAYRTASMPGTLLGSCERVMGVAGEAGEVADYLKKVLCHGHRLDKERLAKELGDVLWYVASVAEDHGLHLSEIARFNIEKLEARYPEKCFSSERSVNRRENDT